MFHKILKTQSRERHVYDIIQSFINDPYKQLRSVMPNLCGVDH